MATLCIIFLGRLRFWFFPPLGNNQMCPMSPGTDSGGWWGFYCRLLASGLLQLLRSWTGPAPVLDWPRTSPGQPAHLIQPTTSSCCLLVLLFFGNSVAESQQPKTLFWSCFNMEMFSCGDGRVLGSVRAVLQLQLPVLHLKLSSYLEASLLHLAALHRTILRVQMVRKLGVKV